MGNFYANIVVRESDVDAVASVVEDLRRRAYVAGDQGVTIIYDERCDDQDPRELEALTKTLSKHLGCVTLAFLNHDDDVLWYTHAERGAIVDRYDSFPGYFNGGSETPIGGDASRLCAAFGVRDRERDVAQLLRQTHHEVGLEIDRHVKLLELLRLPTDLAVFGYRYVEAGELGTSQSTATLRAVGGAPMP